MKQTSVEWLVEVVAKMGYVSTEILEQAKAMHKKEIKDAWVGGKGCLNGEQYYNETYKQD